MTPIATQDVLPWAETITIVSVRPNSSNVTTTATNAGVYRVSMGEAAKSYGVYQAGDIKVTVDQSLGFEPKPRDTITWGGQEYTVLDVSGSNWLTFNTLSARNLTISGDLQQTATVYRATVSPDDYGSRSTTLTAVYSSVACRLQPETREREMDTLGGVKTRASYSCYFGSSVTINAGDTIQVSSVKYEAVSQSEIESISQLTVVACERLT